MEAFVKTRPGASSAYYQAEAAGLRWLREAGAVPVAEVLSVHSDRLVLRRLGVGSPTRAAADEFGRGLARLHRSGAEAFGAPPPGAPRSGYIADLDMRYGHYPTFGKMYAQLRIRPYVDLAIKRGELTHSQLSVFQQLCARLEAEDVRLIGEPEPPSRIHGDLWSGNLLWADDGQAWLIDPAAHGGHRETDLAMLQLFGAPQLDTILESYQLEYPLASGWHSRVALHQVWPLLVHTILFGGGYAEQAVAQARRAIEV